MMPSSSSSQPTKIDDFGMDEGYIKLCGRWQFRFMEQAYWRIEMRGLENIPTTVLVIPNDVQVLLEKRRLARTAKDFTESDRLRDEILSHGFVIQDSGTDQEISLK